MITNTQNLPDQIVRAMENDKYSKGAADYSATELLSPVQQVILKKRYADKITEDASELFWRLLGSAVHEIISRADDADALAEERLFAKIAGKTLSGQSDLYKDGRITDYKVTSAWTRVYGSRIDDWTAQLNIYAYLFSIAGFEVDSLEIIAIYRDWAERDSKKAKYPQIPVESILLPLWPIMQQEAFIKDKILALVDADKLADDDLPECDDEERWWNQRKQCYIRCDKYCPVKNFCQQYERDGFL